MLGQIGHGHKQTWLRKLEIDKFPGSPTLRGFFCSVSSATENDGVETCIEGVHIIGDYPQIHVLGDVAVSVVVKGSENPGGDDVGQVHELSDDTVSKGHHTLLAGAHRTETRDDKFFYNMTYPVLSIENPIEPCMAPSSEQSVANVRTNL